jgi:hypothetical protein
MSPLLPIGGVVVALLALMGGSKKAHAADADATDDTEDDTATKGGNAAGGAATDGPKKAGGAVSDGAAGAAKRAKGVAEAERIIREEAAAVLASGDPAKIEEYAKKIEEYFPDAAKDARAVADAIRKARAAADGGGVTPGPTPGPTPKTPDVVPADGASKAGKKLAADVALMLQQTKPGKEDKSLLQSFSTANNLRNSKGQFDALYGRRVGICLAQVYGIVPPRPPVSWGTSEGGYKSIAPDKQLYRAAMLKMAQQDSARSDEWTAAATAVKG